MKRVVIAASLSSMLVLASCASYEPNTARRDTGIGAATGAAVGAMAHSSNRTHGALAGRPSALSAAMSGRATWRSRSADMHAGDERHRRAGHAKPPTTS